MILPTALLLLAAYVVGLRWMQRRVFGMLKSREGPSSLVLCAIMSAYYCLPLLLAPILGLVGWSIFWVVLYGMASTIITVACWIMFRLVTRR